MEAHTRHTLHYVYIIIILYYATQITKSSCTYLIYTDKT